MQILKIKLQDILNAIKDKTNSANLIWEINEKIIRQDKNLAPIKLNKNYIAFKFNDIQEKKDIFEYEIQLFADFELINIILSVSTSDFDKLYDYLLAKNIIDNTQFEDYKTKRFEKIAQEVAKGEYISKSKSFLLAQSVLENNNCSYELIFEIINKLFYEGNLLNDIKVLLKEYLNKI